MSTCSPARRAPWHGLLLCVLSTLALALPQDDGLLKDFKKFFRKYKDSASRVEAVLALEGQTSADLIDVLGPLLRDKDPAVVSAVVRVLAGCKEPAQVAALLAELEGAKKTEEQVGYLRILEAGAIPHDGVAVAALLTAKAWEVRARAILALAPLGSDVAAPLVLPLCDDDEVAVRVTALDTLAELGADAVREPAGRHLADEAWQVRASAIAALGVVRHRDSVPLLVARLKVEEGRLLDDCVSSLERLTAREFGLRIELWERFWENYKDRYQIPTDEQLAELAKRKAESAKLYKPQPGESTNYHGIQSKSRKVLFVIDVSGSMENDVVEKDRFEDGGYPSFSRMDIVKTELARTIEGLNDETWFNILSFATETDPWKKALVKASVLSKTSATDWTGRLEPIGGASRSELAAVGLGGSANLDAGRTNTWGALAWALAIDPEARKDPYLLEVDTVFFLSDGRPTHGTYVDVEDILKGVREANKIRKVVVHTIAIGEFQKAFMERLAQENGGVFVDLGR